MNAGDRGGGCSRPPPIVYDPLLQGPAWFITHPSVPMAPILAVKTEPDGTLLPVKTEPELPPPVVVFCDFSPDETFPPLPPDTADPLSRAKILLKSDPSPCKEEPSPAPPHGTDIYNPIVTDVDEPCPSPGPLDPPSFPPSVDSPALSVPGVSPPLRTDLDRPASSCFSSCGDLPAAPSPVASEIFEVWPPLRQCYVSVERLAIAPPPREGDSAAKVAVRRGRPPGSKTRPSQRGRVKPLARLRPSHKAPTRTTRGGTETDSNLSNQSPDQSRYISSHEDVNDNSVISSKESAAAPDIPGSLTCDTCGKIFKTVERLTKHVKIHASGKHFVSNTLGVGDGSDLKMHELADSKDNTEASLKTDKLAEGSSSGFECKSCSRVFTWQDDLKDHLLTHSIVHRPSPRGEKAYACEFCSTRFRKKARFDVHVCAQKIKERFKCGTCEKVLKHLKSFKKHVLDHSKVRPDMYPCPLCQREFRKKVSMLRHMPVHNNLRSFECDTCSKVYKHKGNLRHHVLAHITPKPVRVYSCDLCARGFKAKGALGTHMRVHTDARPFACVNCDMRFKSSDVLRNHAVMHTSGKLFQCKICFKHFKRKGDLSKHVKLMHNNSDAPTVTCCCPTCGKLLKNKFTLKTHILTHTIREKYIVCNLCSKGFLTKSALNIHMMSHGNLRPHKCGQCGKGFKATGDLKKHLLVHLEEKKLMCEVCCKTFRYKLCLTSHMETHNDASAHCCTTCGKGFKRAMGLRLHSLTHESTKRFYCDLCSRGFHIKTNLSTHVSICATKPFKCIPCAMAFRSLKRLKIHLLDHGQENAWPKVRFDCEKCVKSFKRKASLVQHLKRAHSDARPWICTFCGKCFKTKDNLNRHSDNHLMPDKALQASS